MARIIFENDMLDLLAELSQEADLYLPVLKNPKSSFSQCSFERFEPGIVPNFLYHTSILPPKDLFLPPKDILFDFQEGRATAPKPVSKILFGVNLCDLRAINRLEKLFGHVIEDEHYQENSSKTTVIAIDEPTPDAHHRCDLYLMSVSEGVFAGFAKTKKGQSLLKNKLFKTKDIKIPRVNRTSHTGLDHPNLSEIVAKSKKHPIWEELAEECFGCGICSYVCPMCYCYATEDTIELGSKTGDKGQRIRTWDSCLLASFSNTNAKNFRPELKDRIYNWYHHKFVRMPKEVGFSGCVECNRCVIFCPAKINYQKTINRLVADWEKNEKN